MQSLKEIQAAKLRPVPTMSARLKSGEIAELILNQKEQKTRLVIWKDGNWKTVSSLENDGERLVPYSVNNNLIQHKVILLPDEPQEYGTVENLFDEIKNFLHRYIDVSPVFEDIAASYVLLSWVYDRFDELPYLRFRGDPGSGKTRCLLTIGSLCYKPIIASGASTVSPIFRLLDTVRGTLILDEGDFRFSDEKAEIIKILNNGNAKGFPVLRSELVNKQEYDPRAFHVYGPKVIATRGYFHDRALETRCLTEEMGFRPIRKDIPLNLPESFSREATGLRSKLLLYRFKFRNEAFSLDRRGNLEPRMAQLMTPLVSVVPTEKVRVDVLDFSENYQRELHAQRGTEIEAQVIEVLIQLIRENAEKISVKDVTRHFIGRFADDYERKITNKWIGNVLRTKLGLKTYKTQGLYFIAQKEALNKIDYLAQKYGVQASS